MRITTHVLDTSLGKPGSGIRVDLQRDGAVVGSGVTDADGRAGDLLATDAGSSASEYMLVFFVAEYFRATGRDAFYSEVVVRFRVGATSQHYHVPLLLSPFGYSTYRGS